MAGKDITINQLKSGGQMPQLTASFAWESVITADIIEQSQDATGAIVETKQTITLSGIIQPFTSEEIALKPDGQRSWSWYRLDVRNIYQELYNGQLINIDGLEYKIMAKRDWYRNNFRTYEIILNYQGA